MIAALCLTLLLQTSLQKPYSFAGFPMPPVLKELDGFNRLMAGNTQDLHINRVTIWIFMACYMRYFRSRISFLFSTVHHLSFADFFQKPTDIWCNCANEKP